ncbi:MAG TPA: hypothetical protein VLH75_08760 [Longimicrobiales bacterium]|nr:hypothetical protein [Longimicrobiales bacterium]
MAVVLLVWLILRRDDLLAGAPSNLDLLVFATLAALALTPLFRKVSLGGVTLEREIREVVKKETREAGLQTLKLRAALDLERMPIWEAENSSIPNRTGEAKFRLLQTKVDELEAQLSAAPHEDRPFYGLALREVYWDLLAAARAQYESSMPYQDIWRRVERGFANLADAKDWKPSR